MAPNLLTNHLHQQRDRIAGMLMPGAKTAPGQRPFSLLLPGFGGQKFRLAARKMRALDPAQLGYLRPEKILQPLIGPVNEARSLLHLKPGVQEDASTPWSQVETIFPSAAAEPEAPARPGELRQGSIIPRMALVPQPGQSLESFKEQVQQRPKVSPPSAEPQKPRIFPKSRLFSRVQEIAAPKTPEEPSGDLPAEETIQRQPDFKREPAPELPKKPAEVEKASQPEKPGSLSAPSADSKTPGVDEPISLPPAPQPGIASRAVTPTPKDETIPPVRAVPVQMQKSAPQERILPQATPIQKPPQPAALPARVLPRAAPAQKQTPTVVPQAARAQTKKPAVKAKPTEQKFPPPLRPKAEAPQRPASQPTPLDVTPAPPHPETTSHPAPDLPIPVEQPSESKLFTPPALPEVTKPVQEIGPAIVSEPETRATDEIEMPLRKQTAYRRQAPAKLKALTPQHVKPKMTTPALTQPEKPLILPQKYRPVAPAVVARQPDEHPLSELLHPAPVADAVEKSQPATASQSQHAHLEDRNSAQLTPTASTRPVSMALAYPPRRAEQDKQIPPTPPPPPAVPTVPTPVETTPQKSAPQAVESPPALRPASVQNVVQRKWPENEGGSSSGDIGGGQAAESPSPGQAQPGFDLAQLAEDVFPYVKRLIEIESDRVSSRFR